MRRRLNERERYLVALTIASAALVGAYQWLLLPSLRRLGEARSAVALLEADLLRLRGNAAVAEDVMAAYQGLDAALFENGGEQIELSEYLRELEEAARLPTLALNNVKPLPVESNGSHKVYPVRITMSGSLAQILEFVHRVCHAPRATGVRALALRALPGGEQVECSVTFAMVSLVGVPPEPGPSPKVASK